MKPARRDRWHRSWKVFQDSNEPLHFGFEGVNALLAAPVTAGRE
jgi:hypothetical protein